VSWIWCNGDFLEGPLAVSPADRGLTHGLGLFETLLAIDGQARVPALHLQRMMAGAERLGWDPEEIPGDLIKAAIPELLSKCGLTVGRARVRIAMTAGAGDLRSLDRGGDALLWMTAAAAVAPPESVRLVTAPFPRNEASPLAGIKCASYAENLIALDHARQEGADEALFFNTRGELCEATTSNVFLVRNGAVVTPPLSSGCLPGTMRMQVIERCFELGIPVAEINLTGMDVKGAEELFVTSAVRGVVPVAGIDGRELSVRPGGISERLRGAML
jgi:branched-subunit amino acid aminotransferase/4-amino-4-deoxychorismate lyase